jgi:hypothetical protein
MKLLKIISFFFIVYFIRRFFQMYGVMKEIQKKQAQMPKGQQGQIIDADFKVVDR